MAVEALMRHGTPLMVDYTPSSAVSAGDVVVVGELPLIAHDDIAADELGALAAGGGVYKVTAGGAASAGAVVYWDDTNDKVTTTSTGNKTFGYVAPDNSAAADGDEIDVIHAPGVRAGT